MVVFLLGKSAPVACGEVFGNLRIECRACFDDVTQEELGV
jgi:hypothetical protein